MRKNSKRGSKKGSEQNAADAKQEAQVPEQIPQLPVQWNRGDKIPTIYTNVVQIQITAFDFRFTFGQFLGIERETIFIDQVATLFMSPMHAKQFAKLLLSNLEQYESQHYKLPPDAAKDAK